MRRLWIDEFYRSYELATEWEDVPEPEKQKAIKTLKSEFGFRPYIEDLLRKVLNLK